jgi:hypothetical protein
MQTEHLKNRRVQIGLWVPELAAQNFRNPQQSTLILCSPNSSPTSRGVCTIKRRRFSDRLVLVQVEVWCQCWGPTCSAFSACVKGVARSCGRCRRHKP